MKKTILVLILLIGIVYKLISTSNYNFLFNMDNARDMIDVREMVVLHKPRLIGPTSGIEGFYNGPAWYYLLAIPFTISHGNPDSEIILMIFLWAIGGYFLIKLSTKFNVFISLTILLLWLSSNYVALATVYSFNPNPVILLTPMLIFLLKQYLEKNQLWSSLGIWILTGLFFNFEMAYGMFVPIVIFLSILIGQRANYIKTKNFWIGVLVFLLFLFPQLIFNLRHQSLLLNSILSYSKLGNGGNLADKFIGARDLYKGVLSGTLMNWSILVNFFLLFFIISVVISVRRFKKLDHLTLISLLLIIIPFLGAVFLPLHIMPWHLGGAMAAVILLIGIFLNNLCDYKFGKYSVMISCLILIIFSIKNLELGHLFNKSQSQDPSNLSNELAAIDYVYQSSNGKNFKVYVYIPSVIDYQYQYLFWWYGQGKYGYLPKDYAYLPNKPPYIAQKEKFSNGVNPPDSGLTFLIKDPNRPDLEDLWKNSFTSLSLLSSAKIGPLVIETRQ